MNARALRRYIDDLLRGRRPKPFRPDDFEAAQIRTAIDLQAARQGSDAPRRGVPDRSAPSACGADRTAPDSRRRSRMRPAGNVIVGTSAAAAAAVAAVSIDRAYCSMAVRSPTAATAVAGAHAERPGAGCGSRPAPTCPTASCGRSMSARSSDSFAVSTASPKPCRGCAPTRAAGCGSTRPTTGCAARAIRRRSRPPARC